MIFRTINKELAVTQMIVDKFEGENHNGFMTTGLKMRLTKVTLVFDHVLNGEHLRAGTEILVKSELAGQKFMQQLLKYGEQTFVLLPEGHVIAVGTSPNTCVVTVGQNG